MHVLSGGSLFMDVVVDADRLAVADFGELRLNVEHEGTELADIHTAAFC